MKIKYDSWHYKWIAKRWDEYPKALCWYFWKIVISIFLIAVIGVATILAAVGILIAIFYPIWQFWHYESGVWLISMCVWGLISGFSLYWHRQWLYSSGKLVKKRKVYKEPGLTQQYMSAAHRKVCPLLDYEHHNMEKN